MIFSDQKLAKLVEDQYIRRTYEGAINPASINIRLGNTFLKLADSILCIDLGKHVEYDRYEVSDTQSIHIKPGEFMLATTKEWIKVPKNCAAFVQGRSSIGRIGLMVQNAGFVDPGFKGHITLELKNDSNRTIILKPGYPIAQLVYMESYGVLKPYSGKYVGQIEATGSRMQNDILKPGNQKEVNVDD